MTKFKVTFEDGVSKIITANYIKPEIVEGWWSYDADGLERYEYGADELKVRLGDTMYFNVETKGIIAGRELTLQLIDYDYVWWMGEQIDEYDRDDKEFPNDPIILNAEVQGVTKQGELYGKSIATVEVLMDETWEPVINEDNVNGVRFNQSIELYWQVKYTNTANKTIKENLPKSKDDYLRVGYNDKDLFVKPIAQNTGIPEFYDNKGKLLIFLFKQANNISKAYNPTPVIEHFIISRITITEVHSLSAINNVKRQLFYENMDLATNTVNTKFGYITEEASDFIIKGEKNFVDVNQFTIKKAKKFSDYFNKRDLPQIRDKALRGGRKALKFLDFINMSKTVLSIFPQEGVTLEMPKPSSVVSAMGLVQAISKIPGFMALSPLFMVADVVATKVVNEILAEFGETAIEMWEQYKLKGLNSALAYAQNSEGAKFIKLDYIQDVHEETYCKFMNGDFQTYAELENYEVKDFNLENPAYYTFFYYLKEEKDRNVKYVIDSIFLQ